MTESITIAKKQYGDKIFDVTFNKLQSIDPTDSKKYLPSLCKFYLQGVSTEDLKTYIQKFDSLKNKNLIEKKDITAYKTFDELKSVIDSVKQSQSKRDITKSIKQNEARKIYENDKYLVIEPLSYNASCKYGKGTKWCISMEDTDEHWREYRIDRELRIYFIFSKILPENNPLSKIAVAFDNDGIQEIENAIDKKLTQEEFFSIITKR